MYTNTCKHCQKLFKSRRKSYCCKECADIDKMRYEQIKAYLRHFPNSNAYQLADALDIDVYTVLKYVEEGSLVVSKGEFEKL
ncbi:MAG: hypothetical protein K6G81_07495 [Lachnospiraceae bacterium]|nr:hypothetical protein [Lachnospiraceae bacterium]